MNEKMCRSLVFARAGGRCERCGGIGRSMHHRKKRSQGGPWSPENVVYVCGDGVRGCHGWIEHNPNDAEAEGFHVRPWEFPDEVPVKWQRSTWYLLLPDGEVIESGPREREEDDMAPEGDDVPPEENGEVTGAPAVPTQVQAE